MKIKIKIWFREKEVFLINGVGKLDIYILKMKFDFYFILDIKFKLILKCK